ncbi:MAG: hypothetical protein CMM87_02765 [Rickettsiales bacterium]|nr:hypothetical protein [Rickettsiales bacterium]|tara:strand:+ start:4345 stop:6447 length:2103 start_codon:yes stop_codon:yes gene_type:complete
MSAHLKKIFLILLLVNTYSVLAMDPAEDQEEPSLRRTPLTSDRASEDVPAAAATAAGPVHEVGQVKDPLINGCRKKFEALIEEEPPELKDELRRAYEKVGEMFDAYKPKKPGCPVFDDQVTISPELKISVENLHTLNSSFYLHGFMSRIFPVDGHRMAVLLALQTYEEKTFERAKKRAKLEKETIEARKPSDQPNAPKKEGPSPGAPPSLWSLLNPHKPGNGGKGFFPPVPVFPHSLSSFLNPHKPGNSVTAFFPGVNGPPLSMGCGGKPSDQPNAPTKPGQRSIVSPAASAQASAAALQATSPAAAAAPDEQSLKQGLSVAALAQTVIAAMSSGSNPCCAPSMISNAALVLSQVVKASEDDFRYHFLQEVQKSLEAKSGASFKDPVPLSSCEELAVVCGKQIPEEFLSLLTGDGKLQVTQNVNTLTGEPQKMLEKFAEREDLAVASASLLTFKEKWSSAVSAEIYSGSLPWKDINGNEVELPPGHFWKFSRKGKEEGIFSFLRNYTLAEILHKSTESKRDIGPVILHAQQNETGEWINDFSSPEVSLLGLFSPNNKSLVVFAKANGDENAQKVTPENVLKIMASCHIYGPSFDNANGILPILESNQEINLKDLFKLYDPRILEWIQTIKMKINHKGAEVIARQVFGAVLRGGGGNVPRFDPLTIFKMIQAGGLCMVFDAKNLASPLAVTKVTNPTKYKP